jgi:hypothetical protein
LQLFYSSGNLTRSSILSDLSDVVRCAMLTPSF